MALISDYYIYVGSGIAALVVAITIFIGFPRWFSSRD